MVKKKTKKAKLMARSRGGSARNVTGVARFEEYSAVQGDGSLDMTYTVSGTFTNGNFVWLYFSVDGEAFSRAANTSLDNLAPVDVSSDEWDAPTFDVGQTVQSYLEVHDSVGELLARSAIVTTPFEP